MEHDGQSSLSERRERLVLSTGLDRLRLINAICRDLVFSDPDEVASLLDEAHGLGESLSEGGSETRVVRGERGESLRLRGVLAFYQGKYAQAVEHLQEAHEAFVDSEHFEGPGNCWNNLAMVYRHLDDYSRALAFYQKALARTREVNDATAEANTLGNIGILYYVMGELEEAGKYIESALDRAVAVGNESLEMVWSNNLAELYLAGSQTLRARPLLERALSLSEARDDVATRIDVLRNFGNLFQREGDVPAAVQNYLKAREAAKAFSDQRMEVELLLALGQLALPLSASARREAGVDPQAVLGEALELAEPMGVNSLLSQAHQALADLFAATGDFRQAFRHLKQHAALAQREKTEETARKLRQQRMLFEVDQTQRELSASRQANAELQLEVERRMQVEADLRDALASARHADEVKTRFLATMSHEIRTPMNGILGMTDVLSRSELDADQREAVDVIFQAGRNLLDLINDILDLTKLEAGHVILRDEEFSLAEVVDSVRDEWAAQAAAKRLSFSVNFPSALYRIYRGDAGRLQQIIRILLSNAVKFTHLGGVLLTLEVADEAGHLRIVVEDTGIGIPKEQFETIFEFFTQLDSSTTRQFGGTGLGLAIADKLAALMGGRLSVESAVGEGSRFALEVPLIAGTLFFPPPPPADLVSHGPLRVLVVEDAEMNWRVVNLLLRKLGVEAVWASDGFRALELVAENPFDLVLMDIQMPGIDGAETTRRIRASSPPDRQPRIVALTAYPIRGGRDPVLNSGVDALLTKPIDLERLRATILATPQLEP